MARNLLCRGLINRTQTLKKKTLLPTWNPKFQEDVEAFASVAVGNAEIVTERQKCESYRLHTGKTRLNRIYEWLLSEEESGHIRFFAADAIFREEDEDEGGLGQN